MTVMPEQQHRGVVAERPGGVPDQIPTQGLQGAVVGLVIFRIRT